MKNARTIRTLRRCGIPADLIGFAGRAAPSGKAIRRMERRDHRLHLAAAREEYRALRSLRALPRAAESQRGFRAVQAKFA